MVFNQTTILLKEEYLMFFMNMMYQSILSWMAVGLASVIGLFEIGKFKAISMKSVLHWVLCFFFILSLAKVHDHWSFLSDCRRELHNYSRKYNITIRNYNNTGKNETVSLMLQPPGNWITKRYDGIFNLPYRNPWLLYAGLIFIILIWARLWYENCINYTEFKEDIFSKFFLIKGYFNRYSKLKKIHNNSRLPHSYKYIIVSHTRIKYF
jgi:hypothetical protein